MSSQSYTRKEHGSAQICAERPESNKSTARNTISKRHSQKLGRISPLSVFAVEPLEPLRDVVLGAVLRPLLHGSAVRCARDGVVVLLDAREAHHGEAVADDIGDVLDVEVVQPDVAQRGRQARAQLLENTRWSDVRQQLMR